MLTVHVTPVLTAQTVPGAELSRAGGAERTRTTLVANASGHDSCVRHARSMLSHLRSGGLLRCPGMSTNDSTLVRWSGSPWDFAVIGVQKAGTTDLTGHLQNHPEVCAAAERRLLLHNGSHVVWTVSRTDWRCGSACATKRGGVDPEASLKLLHHPQLAVRLWESDATKLVLLLREPIQRAWSSFQMQKYDQQFRYSKRYADFAHCVSVEAEAVERNAGIPDARASTVYRGLYAPVLLVLRGAGFTPGLSPGSAGRLLVMISERMSKDEEAGHGVLCAFLGIRSYAAPSWRSSPYSHAPRRDQMPMAAARRLHSLYAISTRHTYRILGEAIQEWEAFYEHITNVSSPLLGPWGVATLRPDGFTRPLPLGNTS